MGGGRVRHDFACVHVLRREASLLGAWGDALSLFVAHFV